MGSQLFWQPIFIIKNNYKKNLGGVRRAGGGGVRRAGGGGVRRAGDNNEKILNGQHAHTHARTHTRTHVTNKVMF